MIKYDGLIKKLRSVGVAKIREDNVIGQATYYGLLNGTCGLTLQTIDKLCAYFQCDVSDLISYENKKSD